MYKIVSSVLENRFVRLIVSLTLRPKLPTSVEELLSLAFVLTYHVFVLNFILEKYLSSHYLYANSTKMRMP